MTLYVLFILISAAFLQRPLDFMPPMFPVMPKSCTEGDRAEVWAGLF